MAVSRLLWRKVSSVTISNVNEINRPDNLAMLRLLGVALVPFAEVDLDPERLVFIDESHVTVPQIGAMFRGDYRRKATLAEYGFRLPSCVDKRH